MLWSSWHNILGGRRAKLGYQAMLVQHRGMGIPCHLLRRAFLCIHLFSLRWVFVAALRLPLGAQASIVAACRLWSTWTSVVVAQELGFSWHVESSQARDRTRVPCIGRWILIQFEPPGKSEKGFLVWGWCVPAIVLGHLRLLSITSWDYTALQNNLKIRFKLTLFLYVCPVFYSTSPVLPLLRWGRMKEDCHDGNSIIFPSRKTCHVPDTVYTWEIQ